MGLEHHIAAELASGARRFAVRWDAGPGRLFMDEEPFHLLSMSGDAERARYAEENLAFLERTDPSGIAVVLVPPEISDSTGIGLPDFLEFLAYLASWDGFSATTVIACDEGGPAEGAARGLVAAGASALFDRGSSGSIICGDDVEFPLRHPRASGHMPADPRSFHPLYVGRLPEAAILDLQKCEVANSIMLIAGMLLEPADLAGAAYGIDCSWWLSFGAERDVFEMEAPDVFYADLVSDATKMASPRYAEVRAQLGRDIDRARIWNRLLLADELRRARDRSGASGRGSFGVFETVREREGSVSCEGLWRLGREYGVDVAVGLYERGVPVDDIVA